MKRHYDHGNSYKEKHFIEVAYIFRGLVHCCHGGKHGGMQTDIVLEKQLRVEKELHLDPTGTRKWSAILGVLEHI